KPMERPIMGDRVKELRKKRRLTQEQLAEKIGISLQYVSEIERGLSMPSMQVFLKLLEVLDASADYLLRDMVSCANPYGDKQIAARLERLSPKQRQALMAIIDAYMEYLD
ncbi:MAG: helix-turn-helix transcriptional regulator, partial [Clostridia bacterium]|nr:helix-turn-helix transcriptional regulator [Clostridia bacterium]